MFLTNMSVRWPLRVRTHYQEYDNINLHIIMSIISCLHHPNAHTHTHTHICTCTMYMHCRYLYCHLLTLTRSHTHTHGKKYTHSLTVSLSHTHKHKHVHAMCTRTQSHTHTVRTEYAQCTYSLVYYKHCVSQQINHMNMRNWNSQ